MQVGAYLDRMAAGEDIGTTAAEAYKLIEVEESGDRAEDIQGH